jgi:thymidylate kinase
MSKKHIILCEGLDGVGKTTLLTRFRELYQRFSDRNLNYFHCSFPKGENNEERYGYQMGLNHTILDMLELSNEDWLFDRSFLGEATWSKVYRERPAKYLPDIVKKWNDLDCHKTLIYVQCDENVVLERFKKYRPDEEEPIPETYKVFQESFKKTCMSLASFENSILVDTSKDPDPDQLALGILLKIFNSTNIK